MDLIAVAVPFFLLALLIELGADRVSGKGYYRLNDAIASLSTGILNTTTGYFTRFVSVIIWGAVLQHLALFELTPSDFDLSVTGIALWLIAIVGWDLCYYWFHRISHEISVFWAGHAVHHQSEDYNLSTALRQPSTGFLLGWVFYLPMFVLGFPLEILVTVNAVNLIYQFWVHTQFVGKLGVLDGILVTPSNHRVHHAQNATYIDRNYGGMFIVWDRIFGTFQEELDDEPPIYGVRRPLNSWNPFWANLHVYAHLLQDSIATRRWADKIGVWFARTGWRPADAEARHPAEKSDLEDFHRYDRRAVAPIALYAMLQFVACVAGTLWISALLATGGTSAVLGPSLLLWLTLYTTALLSEGRSYALAAESIRIALFAIVAWKLPALAGLSAPASIAWWYLATSVAAFLLAILVVRKQQVKAIYSSNTEAHS